MIPECFYPSCEAEGAWFVYSGGWPDLRAMSCVEHIGHAIAKNAVEDSEKDPKTLNSYLVVRQF